MHINNSDYKQHTVTIIYLCNVNKYIITQNIQSLKYNQSKYYLNVLDFKTYN